jgi:L-lactate dehydrogenase complex protein LldG
MSQARRAILGRVRMALAEVPAGETAQWEGPEAANAADAYRVGPAAGEADRVALFAERVADYRAEVIRCTDVAAAVADACRRQGAARMVAPDGVAPQWLGDGVDWLREPLSLGQLDAVDGVLSGATVAIAETGTVALAHGPGEGRRALTLVPDLHVCVVRADQIVAAVPEGLRLLRPAVDAGRPVTLISGPSATSDIELERVEGVHGPRRLVVLIAG